MQMYAQFQSICMMYMNKEDSGAKCLFEEQRNKQTFKQKTNILLGLISLFLFLAGTLLFLTAASPNSRKF